jgi:hypothetical protein
LEIADRVRELIGLSVTGQELLRHLGIGRARRRPQG